MGIAFVLKVFTEKGRKPPQVCGETFCHYALLLIYLGNFETFHHIFCLNIPIGDHFDKTHVRNSGALIYIKHEKS